MLTAAFLLALAAVLCARDPLTFLAGWELMTLLPAALILVARGGDRLARETVFSYVAITLSAAPARGSRSCCSPGGGRRRSSAIETGSGCRQRSR